MDHDVSLDQDDLLDVTNEMTLRAEVQGHRVRVVVRGEVDVATATALRTFILGAGTPGMTEQVIDLSEVTFLDSSGSRALILASREAAAAGVGFSLQCPTENTAVSRVLEILQIDSMMTVVTTDSRQRR